MKTLLTLSTLLMMILGGATVAAAQDMPPEGFGRGGGQQGMRGRQMPEFAELDKNKDKKISKDEMPSQFPSQFFDRFDENKDGFIDEQEWNRLRQRMGGGGGGPRTGDRLVQFMDANKDNNVTTEEFSKIAELFDALDADKSGDLAQEELNRFFQALNPDQNRQQGDRQRGGEARGGDGRGGDGRGGPGRGFQMPNFAELDKNSDKKLTKDEIPENFPPQMVERYDQNKDGIIEESEWNRSRPRPTGERFIEFMDANKDTKVSREEFARANELFGALDKDKSAGLSADELNEFFQGMAEVQARATGGVAVNNLFDKFDKDKDGKITAAEMGNERTFNALDLNKDGSVDREEADKALKALAERSKKQ